jgi:disulfide bond formation protein DsbB
MHQPSPRSATMASLAGFLLAVASMVFAVGYLQMVEYLEPCPLCILDRGVVIGLGAVFLLFLMHRPGVIGRRIYATLATLLSLTGIGISARHVWLQNLPPDQVPECGAGFWHNLDTLPFNQFVDTLFNGSGECAEIQWQFAGLSIPQLTLILFVVFLLVSLFLFFCKSR